MHGNSAVTMTAATLPRTQIIGTDGQLKPFQHVGEHLNVGLAARAVAGSRKTDYEAEAD